MAKTKKKRRRKHRGTQGGRVDTRPTRRPRSRAEAKAQAAQRRSAAKKGKSGGRGAGGKQTRPLVPPTWKGSFAKGGFAAILFFGLFAGLFHKAVGYSAAVSLAMLGFYVPMSFYVDGFIYRRKMRELTKPKPQPAPAPEPEPEPRDDGE